MIFYALIEGKPDLMVYVKRLILVKQLECN